MKIIRGRLKPQPGTTYEFISVKSRIKALIEKTKGDNFDFVIDDGGRKSVMSFGPDHLNSSLIGKEIPIISNDTVAKFNEDGTIAPTSVIKAKITKEYGDDVVPSDILIQNVKQKKAGKSIVEAALKNK